MVNRCHGNTPNHIPFDDICNIAEVLDKGDAFELHYQTDTIDSTIIDNQPIAKRKASSELTIDCGEGKKKKKRKKKRRKKTRRKRKKKAQKAHRQESHR